MDPAWQTQLEQGLAALDIVLEPSRRKLLVDYLALLAKWNKAFNLTAVRDTRHMVERHLLDSLAVLPYVQGERIVDIGAGAGLPGIPLAIAAPERHFVLVDSNSKKTRFLNQVRLELGLVNVEVVHSRAEAFEPEDLFDTVVSRAFASLADFWRLSHHLLAHGGVMLAMKGPRPEVELREFGAVCPIAPEVIVLDPPGAEGERTLVRVRVD